MNILISSIVDLKKSQHNRPHQFVKYFLSTSNSILEQEILFLIYWFNNE